LARDKFAIGKWLFTILAAEAFILFILRLPGTLQFDNFAFFDTGANLTAQFLLSRGYRPTIDFDYHYGLLPLLLGRIWFSIFGLTPLACAATVPLLDIFIIWGFVRFATNIKMNLAGISIILLTAPLTVPSSFLNLAHGIEPAFLLHALAYQVGGDRRRALAFGTACVFVKPSMAYFLGLVLLVFIVSDCLRNRARLLRTFFAEAYPAVLVGIGIATILAAVFGWALLVRTLIPSEGRAMYRALGFGIFNGAGRSFLAPYDAPWSYYLANTAGPWIVYTIILVMAALVEMPKLLTSCRVAGQNDLTPQIVITCAVLHLSFIFLFFGNEFSWLYYFYVPVLGLAAAARLGVRWEILVVCLAFAIPLTKVDKRFIQHFALTRKASSAIAESSSIGLPAVSALPVESGFTYQLWFTTSPSAETAGLWAPPVERAEWMRVLAMTLGQRTAILEYYGCADLLFPQFIRPVTLFLVPGVSAADISRKISQLETSSMIVMPRWHRGLLSEFPAIGDLVRHDFVLAFQGTSFVVYTRRKKLNSIASKY